VREFCDPQALEVTGGLGGVPTYAGHLTQPHGYNPRRDEDHLPIGIMAAAAQFVPEVIGDVLGFRAVVVNSLLPLYDDSKAFVWVANLRQDVTGPLWPTESSWK
jgi:hypothetical protein